MFTENPQSHFLKKRFRKIEESHTISYVILKLTGI